MPTLGQSRSGVKRARPGRWRKAANVTSKGLPLFGESCNRDLDLRASQTDRQFSVCRRILQLEELNGINPYFILASGSV